MLVSLFVCIYTKRSELDYLFIVLFLKQIAGRERGPLFIGLLLTIYCQGYFLKFIIVQICLNILLYTLNYHL